MAKERDSRFEEMFAFPIKNVEIIYPYLFDPDTKYTPVWKCTVILPDPLADAMESKGFNIKEKDFGSGVVKYIVAKRKTHTSQNKAMYPPKVYEADGQTYWDKSVAIGNGTRVNLSVAAKYVTVSGNESLPLYLNAVQVLKHVPYSTSPFEDCSSDQQQDSI